MTHQLISGSTRPQGGALTPSRMLVSSRRLPVLVAAVCLAFAVLAASALAGYVSVGTFANTGSGNGGSGTGQGELLNPGRAVIHQATGHLYVADTGNDRVQVFDTDGDSGSYLTEFGAGTLDRPFGLAIDQDSGDVYVSDTNNTRVVKYESDGQPTPSFTQDPGFTSPTAGGALAFDQMADQLLVADPADNLVKGFDTTGGAVGTPFDGSTSPGGAFTGLLDLAVDSTGDILVVDSSRDVLTDVDWNTGQPTGSGSRVERFDSAGTWEATIGPVNGPGAIAVDPDDDQVIVAGKFHAWNSGQLPHLYTFASDGAPVVDVDIQAMWAVTPGLAPVGAGSKHLYAVTKDPYGEFYGPTAAHVLEDLPAPTATIAATTDITESGATVNGMVNPNGLDTGYQFEYSADGTDWLIVALSNAGDGTSDLPVDESLGGLEPSREYHVRLRATSAAGGTTSGTDSFTTDAIPPSLRTNPAASKVTKTSARLVSRVNPHNSPTTYHFEYGTDTSYGQSAPATEDGSVADGNELAVVFEDVDGLQPDTTYHYRLIATNEAGTTTGPDRTLTTRSTDPDAVGPKDSVIPGRGFLPNNRGWEMVSPDDQNDSEIRKGTNFQAAADGESVVYAADGGFGDTQTSLLAGQYLARRGPNGWTSKGIATPSGTQDYGASINYFKSFGGFSKDLTRGVLRTAIGDPAAAPGMTGAVRNLVVLTPGENDGQLITPTPDPLPDPGSAFASFPMHGQGSDDYSHIAFQSPLPLTPDAPPGVTNVYEWHDGQTRLVNIAPDGAAIEVGAQLGRALGDTAVGERATRSVSEDGSRIFFTSGPFDRVGDASARLYMREDGTTTVEVSASQRTTPSETGPRSVRFETASADGSRVFFRTCQELTNDSVTRQTGSEGFTDCNSRTSNAYMYEAETGELTNLSAGDTAGGDVVDILDVSPDGRYVYFVAGGLLDGDEGERGQHNLYVWHEGDVRYIATLAMDTIVQNAGYGIEFRPRAQVHGDGRYLIFLSERQLADGVTGGQRQVLHRYDYRDDSITCLACRPDGQPSTSDTALDSRDTFLFYTLGQYVPRSANESASQFYFQTADPLVPEDVNGRWDVYQYEDGQPRLLSDGVSNHDSELLDASEDGSEVFFVTRNRLVAGDHDNLTDVYVAKVGGGFPEQAKPSPCVEDACQPDSAPRPGRSTPGSAALDGAGDASHGERARVSLRVSQAQRAKLARGGQIALRVRVNRAGRVRVTARAKIGNRRWIVASGSRRARRAGVVTVRLRLSKQARARLDTNGRALRTVFEVRFANATQRLSLTLKRGR